jgi:carboxymethylenebutenolidase
MNVFACRPEGGGSWPPIIFYTDALGLREELRDMVRRLATVGYPVLLLDVSLPHGNTARI